MPSSVRSGQRAAVRRADVAPQSLGLEEELSFGSDEDLMETIGEIDVPTAPSTQELGALKKTQVNASTNSLKRPGKSSKASTLSLRSHKSKVTEASLASSTHLLPPLPPVPSGSTLDLPSEMFGDRDGETGSVGSRKHHKRGSLMGTFKSVKGLRKWRDDHSNKSSLFSHESNSPQTSTLSLSKMGSNTCEYNAEGFCYCHRNEAFREVVPRAWTSAVTLNTYSSDKPSMCVCAQLTSQRRGLPWRRRTPRPQSHLHTAHPNLRI